ncbi:MAG: hemin uptake protein HemP [Pseudomonadota bacterium]
MTAVPQPISPNVDLNTNDAMPTYDVRDMIEEGVQARLVLDRQAYYLRITRAGKLILTK